MQAEVRYKELYSKKSFLKLNMPMTNPIYITTSREDSFSVVILRSSANGGTRKNLKVLRGVYPFDRTCRRGVRLRLTRSPQVESLRAGSE
jgi:hypothetical protein